MSERLDSEESAPLMEIHSDKSVAYYVNRELDDLKKQLRAGATKMANLTTVDEEQDRARAKLSEDTLKAAMKLEHDLNEKIGEHRRALDEKIDGHRRALDGSIDTTRRALEGALAALQDTVNPRMTLWRVAGWIAVIVVPTAVAAAGWIAMASWSAARYPDRADFDKVSAVVQQVHTDMEVIKKGGHP